MASRQCELPLDLEIFLCFAIYSANHAFNRIYQPLLEGLGLTYPQYIVIVLLWDRDGQTVGELGQRLFLESNTVTPLLKRLEAIGHVTRRRDPTDERQVRIYLTDSGSKLRQRAVNIPRCILDASGMDGGQAKRLLQEISELRKTLESHRSNSKNPKHRSRVDRVRGNCCRERSSSCRTGVRQIVDPCPYEPAQDVLFGKVGCNDTTDEFS